MFSDKTRSRDDWYIAECRQRKQDKVSLTLIFNDMIQEICHVLYKTSCLSAKYSRIRLTKQSLFSSLCMTFIDLKCTIELITDLN